jgi:hypothetical protein
LYKRRKQSGKRAAVKGHFMLSTAEIRDNVQEAEKETARKAIQPATRKRKRQETPPEDEKEYIESSSDSGFSDMSDCIVVSQC